MNDKINESVYDNLGLKVIGRVKVTDDLGEVLLEKNNAIHPRNMARIIARALANEGNSSVYRIAFGNGGTLTDASFNVTFNTPNDGLPPDVSTWNSRLYNETYSEIVDDGDANIGTDPGSSDASGSRPGGGAVPGTEAGAGVFSNEIGNTSEVVITAIINASEPTGQLTSGVPSASDGSFVFDEIGLYTSGADAAESIGYGYIDVGTKNSEDDTGLVPGAKHSFKIEVDNSGVIVDIDFTVPASGSGTGGEILYGDMVEALNTGDTAWNTAWTSSPLPAGSVVKISDATTLFPTTTGAETFGFLQFLSGSTGAASAIKLLAGDVATTTDLFAALGGSILTPVAGTDAGVENNTANPALESERLLSHLIFQPIFKSSSREITVSYTLTIAVARTA